MPREFRKLVIAFFTSKKTLNLINLSLFLKIRNEVKTVNKQKLKEKKNTYQLLMPIFDKGPNSRRNPTIEKVRRK